ncbi:MAG: hypothetical protein ACTIIO_07200, partial [Psychrobacter celer]
KKLDKVGLFHQLIQYFSRKGTKAVYSLAGYAPQCDNGRQFTTLIFEAQFIEHPCKVRLSRLVYAVYRSVNGSIYLHDEQRVKTCSA